MAYWARRMRAQFEEIRRTHRGEGGRRREDDVREFLQQFLPQKLAVGTGEIVAANGEVSPQIDLIVYDALETPLLDRSESSVVVPVEGVYGVIEVSSNLTTSKFTEDVNKLRAVKQLPKEAYFRRQGSVEVRHSMWGQEFEYVPILGFCFGYESVDLRTLAEALTQIDDAQDAANNVDMVCSLSEGCIANAVPTENEHGEPAFTQIAGCPDPGTVRLPIPASNEPLMLFYLLAGGLLAQGETRPLRMALYMGS